MKLHLKGAELDLSTPAVMGVLNLTPDSFSDGDRWSDVSHACARAWAMTEEGAKIIDIGGESTRPGAQPVPEHEELKRVIPVIERLVAERLPALISIDSMKPGVMRTALAAGAAMLNDVNALRAAGAVEVAVQSGAAVCLMHMQGNPGDMQRGPVYHAVTSEVMDYLLKRAEVCVAAGLPRGKIVIDPGFGFGKTLEHNLALLAELGLITACGFPVLVGMSRKSMLGAILDVPVGERGHGHSAAVAIAVMQGAKILRAHDVRATLQAAKIADRVRRAAEEKGVS